MVPKYLLAREHLLGMPTPQNPPEISFEWISSPHRTIFQAFPCVVDEPFGHRTFNGGLKQNRASILITISIRLKRGIHSFS
jgi:hypothetical protein